MMATSAYQRSWLHNHSTHNNFPMGVLDKAQLLQRGELHSGTQ
jgi:hypothetical protein